MSLRLEEETGSSVVRVTGGSELPALRTGDEAGLCS